MDNLVEDFNLRRQSLGSFYVLSDSFILSFIKRYVAIPDLVTLSAVSRLFYLLAENEEVWKRICIRKFGGDFLFKGSWKRTALVPRHVKLPPYKRLVIPSYYSTKLYKKWYRSNTSLEPWKHLPVQNIDRRSNLSVKEFKEEYESKNKPVILTDIVPKWRAAKAWTIENLLKKYSNEKFKTDEPDPRGGKMYMKLPDYLEYAKSNHDEDPIYLFDDKFNERPNCKDLLDDYIVPPYFQEDYFTCLEDERPPYRWVAIGPERSGTPFHIDPYRTSAWNGLISGRKRWCLYPYNQFPPGINMEWDDDGNFDHDSPYPLKWYLEVYPHLAPHEKPIEFIMEPGELVFVPSGWWHQVINLEETVAVTQNYCNDSNFETVCSEMNFDDEDFYEDFQESVEKKYPNIKWPKNLPKSGFKK